MWFTYIWSSYTHKNSHKKLYVTTNTCIFLPTIIICQFKVSGGKNTYLIVIYYGCIFSRPIIVCQLKVSGGAKISSGCKYFDQADWDSSCIFLRHIIVCQLKVSGGANCRAQVLQGCQGPGHLICYALFRGNRKISSVMRFFEKIKKISSVVHLFKDIEEKLIWY